MLEQETLFIECKKCGSTEEQPADQQRKHIQNFDLVAYPEERNEEDDGNAYYKCGCGNEVRSTIENEDSPLKTIIMSKQEKKLEELIALSSALLGKINDNVAYLYKPDLSETIEAIPLEGVEYLSDPDDATSIEVYTGVSEEIKALEEFLKTLKK